MGSNNAAQARKSYYFMCKNLHFQRKDTFSKEAIHRPTCNLRFGEFLLLKVAIFKKGLFRLVLLCDYIGKNTCVLYFLLPFPYIMYYECRLNLNAKYITVHYCTFYYEVNTKWYLLASFSEFQKSLSFNIIYIHLSEFNNCSWFVTFG